MDFYSFLLPDFSKRHQMKPIKLLVSSLLLACLLVSCNKKNEERAYIELPEGSTLTVPFDGGDYTVDVNTSFYALNVELTPKVSWCKAQLVGKKLHVKVYENQNEDYRTVNITLSVKGVKPVTLVVSQDGADEGSIDPYKPAIPEEFYDYMWNDKWTIFNWIYNGDKWENIAYAENGLDVRAKTWYKPLKSTNFAYGILLSQELLDYFGGKTLTLLSLYHDLKPEDISQIEVSVCTVKESDDDADTPAWKKGKCYDVDEVIFKTSDIKNNGSGYMEWSDESKNVVLPKIGKVMILYRVEATKALNVAKQPANKFAPGFINDESSDANGMFPFYGGTPQLVFKVKN